MQSAMRDGCITVSADHSVRVGGRTVDADVRPDPSAGERVLVVRCSWLCNPALALGVRIDAAHSVMHPDAEDCGDADDQGLE
jgi:hypothetical protein